MHSLRILYLSWRDAEHPEAGGSEAFVERTSEHLCALGDEVTIFASRAKGLSAQARHGAVYVRRRGGHFSCYPAGLAYVVRHRHDFDVIIDVQNGLPFWSPLVTRLPVVNLLHHLHRAQWETVFGRYWGRLGWLLESRVAPLVYRRSRYVTVSDSTRRELAGLGVHPSRVTVVHNGNDKPAHMERYEAIHPSPTPRLIVLCRLVPHKQVEYAIDVLARLRDEYPDLALDIVGAGYWQQRLVAHARDRGVADAVVFHGFVDEESKHRLLAHSWVMLLPSAKEGWGLTIVEAGLHAVPAVAFRSAGGPTDSIRQWRTGVLADDLDDMVEATRTLLSDGCRRAAMGEAAKRWAGSFDWERSAVRLRQVLLAAHTGKAQHVPADVGEDVLWNDEEKTTGSGRS